MTIVSLLTLSAVLQDPTIAEAAQQAAQSAGEAVGAIQADTPDHSPGHGALDIFNAEGRLAMPAWVGYWIQVMLASFVAGLVFVWKHVAARWVVGGFVGTVALMGLLNGAFGLLPLGGLIALVHLITWSPGYILLWKAKPWTALDSWFGRWATLMIGVISFSFIFDIRDAAIYLDYMLGIGLIS